MVGGSRWYFGGRSMFYCCIGLREIQHRFDDWCWLAIPICSGPSPVSASSTHFFFRFPHQNLSLTEFSDHRPPRASSVGALWAAPCLNGQGVHCNFGEAAPNNLGIVSPISLLPLLLRTAHLTKYPPLSNTVILVFTEDTRRDSMQCMSENTPSPQVVPTRPPGLG